MFVNNCTTGREGGRLFITQQTNSALKLARTSLLGSCNWIARITVETQISKWVVTRNRT